MGRMLQVICGCLLAVALGASQAQSTSTGDGVSPPQQGQSRTGENLLVAESNARLGGHLEAANRETQRAEADLKAQQEMARWALGMFIASSVSVVIGAVGVALIYITFQQTRVAATAAREGVKDLRAQTRAHLRIENVYGNLMGNNIAVPRALLLSVEVTNAGNTQGMGISVAADVTYDGTALPPLELEDTSDPRDGMIPQGGAGFWRIVLPDLSFDHDVLQTGGYKDKPLTAEIRLSYLDIYGERHSQTLKCEGPVWAAIFLRGDRGRPVNAHLKPVA